MPPFETTIWLGLYARPLVSRYSQIASCSGRMPELAVYLTWPASRAACAAAITGGAGKMSGSPTERETIFLPSSLRAAALSETATVLDSLSPPTSFDSWMAVGAPWLLLLLLPLPLWNVSRSFRTCSKASATCASCSDEFGLWA